MLYDQKAEIIYYKLTVHVFQNYCFGSEDDIVCFCQMLP